MSSPSPTSAPIRRLPTETLIDILSVYSFSPAHYFPHVYATELDCLANVRLLTFSRVCSRWHSIVVGTSLFWTSFNLNGVLWDTSSRLETTLRLLSSLLERGLDSPICFVFDDDHNLPPPLRIFHLLAQHSRRWLAAAFFSSVEGIDLSVLRGRLPLVKELELILPKSLSKFDFLDGTPLKTLFINSPFLDDLDTFTFKHITGFGYDATSPMHITKGMTLLPKLKAITDFYLSFHIDFRKFPNHRITLRIAPQTLHNVTEFSCNLSEPFLAHHCQQALGEIFASLTLPKLQTLSFKAAEYPRCVLGWPDHQFLGLVERSGLCSSLKVLKIAHVRITETELTHVLSALPKLEHLEIADKRRVGLGIDLLLITDNLLRCLTRTTASTDLAPRLRSLVCASRLKFTHSLFLDFIRSRLEPFATSPMCVDIQPLMEDDGHLEPAVHAQLQELALKDRQLVYMFGGAEFSLSSYLPRAKFYPRLAAAAAGASAGNSVIPSLGGRESDSRRI
ncbi:hypothetical protein B0H12DRAFT_1135356 [Mycena haematopus]|nr:hypothetical protein B0H12DRAFT_1135356 [Mycena haematopus]